MENAPKREVCKPFSIKMYQEDIDRFQKIASEMDNVKSNREAFNALMDFFENPKTVKIDNPELIKKNQELQDEIDELTEENASLKQRIEDLNAKVEELINSGNESAMSAQKIQLELEALKEESEHQAKAKANRPANIFEVEVHPVAFHFLKKMSEYLSAQKKAEVTPGYILVDLFLKDLQNPRSNNLPYIVSSDEIRKVMEEYRKAHSEEN